MSKEQQINKGKGSKSQKNVDSLKKGTKNGKIKQRAQLAAEEQQKSAQKRDPNAIPMVPHDDNPDIQRGLYSDELLPRVEELAASGLNNNQIATALCIGNRTFYDWLKRFPQFRHSLKKYRGVADIQVENALFKNAIGHTFTEVKRERRYNKQTQEFEIVVTEMVEKHIPGNPVSQIFYLKNRMPHRYKDKVETVHSIGEGLGQIAFMLKRRED